MIPLQTQEQFEGLLRQKNTDKTVVFAPVCGVAFGAEWCGPCRRLDKDAIADRTPWVRWYYCDVDENNYTPGYCSVQSIPCFVLIVNGVYQPTKITSSSVDEIVQRVGLFEHRS